MLPPRRRDLPALLLSLGTAAGLLSEGCRVPSKNSTVLAKQAATSSLALPRKETMLEPHPYYPILIGMVWEYELQDGSNRSAESPLGRNREQVTDLHFEQDDLIATIVSEIAGNPAAKSERHAKITHEGISPDPTPMSTVIGMVKATAVEGCYLPRDLFPGRRWSYSIEFDSPIQTSSVTASLLVLSAEEVDVPAGRFAVVRISSTLRNRMVAKTAPNLPPGIELPIIEHTQTEESYWARGVGLIKAVTRTSSGHESTKELVGFSPGTEARWAGLARS